MSHTKNSATNLPKGLHAPFVISNLSYLLLYITIVSIVFGFFLWLPDKAATLWLRRFFLYISGVSSLFYLLIAKPKFILRKTTLWILGAFITLSTIALLRSQSPVEGLIGQPVIHPGLISLLASLAIGAFFIRYKRSASVYVLIYISLVIFGLTNLLAFLLTDTARLGSLGIQVNYTAYLFIVGLIIGNWLIKNDKLTPLQLVASQLFLLLCTLLTQSRIPIAIGICFFILFLNVLWHHSYKRLAVCLAGIILVLGIIFTFLASNRVISYSYLRESSLYRLELVQAARPDSLNHWILGGGIGSIEQNIDRRGQDYVLISQDLKGGWLFESSHNYFVDVLIERGILALLLFLAIVIVTIKQGFESKDIYDKLLLSILLVSLAFLTFNNINLQQEVVVWCCIVGILIHFGASRLRQE